MVAPEDSTKGPKDEEDDDEVSDDGGVAAREKAYEQMWSTPCTKCGSERVSVAELRYPDTGDVRFEYFCAACGETR